MTSSPRNAGEAGPDSAAQIGQAVDRLCRRVGVSAEFTVGLTAWPSLRDVRATIGDIAGFGLGRGDLADVLLVVDELITNAYVHAGGAVEVRLTRQVRGFLIEVLDLEPECAQVRPRSSNGLPAGYGLRVVDRVSLAWGARQEDQGKTVWALVATGRQPSATAA